jgi:hypothetical protein
MCADAESTAASATTNAKRRGIGNLLIWMKGQQAAPDYTASIVDGGFVAML